MNYDSIITKIREELEKEMSIREEIIYKKGFAEGLKEAKSKDEKEDDIFSLVEDAIEVGLDCALTIEEMDKKERFKLFGSECLSGIMADWEPLEIAEVIRNYLVSKVKKENKKEHDSEIIGEILDSNLSDEMKKMILQAIDEGAEVKIIEIQ